MLKRDLPIPRLVVQKTELPKKLPTMRTGKIIRSSVQIVEEKILFPLNQKGTNPCFVETASDSKDSKLKIILQIAFNNPSTRRVELYCHGCKGSVGWEGIEPSTSFLPARRVRCARIESNYRPLLYQRSVLPLNYMRALAGGSGKRSTSKLPAPFVRLYFTLSFQSFQEFRKNPREVLTGDKICSKNKDLVFTLASEM